MNAAHTTGPRPPSAKQATGARLSPELITRDLAVRIIGRTVLCYQSVESTNDIAARLAKAGEPEGTLIIAEEQSKGRGRLGRPWQAPPMSSLLMSIIFYPSLLPSQTQRIAMICSLGLLAGIGLATGLEAQLKWPNDILIGDKKAAGLLAEAGISGDEVSFVVVGMGLNVNLDPAILGDVATPPTSIAHELGHPVDRLALLRHILCEIDTRYLSLRQGWSPREEWAANLATLGRSISVYLGDEVLSGVAEDVDEDGMLLLRGSDGTLHRLAIGDVTSHPPQPTRLGHEPR